jgi:hypothetical protein
MGPHTLGPETTEPATEHLGSSTPAAQNARPISRVTAAAPNRATSVSAPSPKKSATR